MVVTAIVEIPLGSANKYEYDPVHGCIRLDRVLFSAAHYPVNYGFIPGTWAQDNDPLDVLIMGSTSIHPGVEVEVRVLGALLMEDEHGPDAKVMGVVDRDPRCAEIRVLQDLGAHRLQEIQHFFREYKTLQGIKTTVGGYHPETVAIDLIHQSRDRFVAKKRREQASPLP